MYVTFEEPLSGTSMNPARTLGSAIFADLFTGLWVYFTAPVLGMLAAVEVSRVLAANPDRLCAKLTHGHKTPCILKCHCMEPAGIKQQNPKAPLPRDAARYPHLDAGDLAALRALAE